MEISSDLKKVSHCFHSASIVLLGIAAQLGTVQSDTIVTLSNYHTYIF